MVRVAPGARASAAVSWTPGVLLSPTNLRVYSYQPRVVLTRQFLAFLPNCHEVLQGKSLAEHLAHAQCTAPVFIQAVIF